MENEHRNSSLIAIKNFKANQNQNTNAVVIDCMLVNFGILVKKIIVLRKHLKQHSQAFAPFSQPQLSEKITVIADQTKNLGLNLPKDIPPDKRMTNLFYMRITKQIANYKKVMPSLIDILPLLQQNYAEQLKSQIFSITALYLICQKKFIQEINMAKKKNIQILELMKLKSGPNNLKTQQNTLNPLIARQVRQFNPLKKMEVSQKTSDNLIECVIFQSDTKKACNEKCLNPAKNVDEIMKMAKKSDLFQDFHEKIPLIFSAIYSPLDIGQLQIIDNYVVTLRPEDNIDIIYEKVKKRNKKTVKQIKQFASEYLQFQQRKEQILKRRFRRTEIKQFQIQKNDQKQFKSSFKKEDRYNQGKHQSFKISKQKNYSMTTTVQSLKPLIKQDKVKERERLVSHFRKRLKSSLETSEQVNQKLLFSQTNNIQGNSKNKLTAKSSFKLKNRRSAQSQNSGHTNKENWGCQTLAQGSKAKNNNIYEIKITKTSQKKKSGQTKIQINKEAFAKRLKL